MIGHGGRHRGWGQDRLAPHWWHTHRLSYGARQSGIVVVVALWLVPAHVLKTLLLLLLLLLLLQLLLLLASTQSSCSCIITRPSTAVVTVVCTTARVSTCWLGLSNAEHDWWHSLAPDKVRLPLYQTCVYLLKVWATQWHLMPALHHQCINTGWTVLRTRQDLTCSDHVYDLWVWNWISTTFRLAKKRPLQKVKKAKSEWHVLFGKANSMPCARTTIDVGSGIVRLKLQLKIGCHRHWQQMHPMGCSILLTSLCRTALDPTSNIWTLGAVMISPIVIVIGDWHNLRSPHSLFSSGRVGSTTKLFTKCDVNNPGSGGSSRIQTKCYSTYLPWTDTSTVSSCLYLGGANGSHLKISVRSQMNDTSPS